MLPEEVSESEINESIKVIKEALAEINIKRAEFKIALRDIEEEIEELDESWSTTSGKTTKKKLLEEIQNIQDNQTIMNLNTIIEIEPDKIYTSSNIS